MRLPSLILWLLASAAGPALVSARGACNILPASIICMGDRVNNNELLALAQEIEARYQDFHFLQVIISETKIKNIAAGMFKGITFENLLIEGNHDLLNIDPQAFDEQTQCKSLMIVNNEQLSDNNVFKLIRRLNIHELIDFDYNGLKEVPPNAFSQPLLVSAAAEADATHDVDKVIVPTKIFFRKLAMSNNHIEHVATNAFHSIYSCNQIYLNLNKINRLDVHSFNLLTNLTTEDNDNVVIDQTKAEKLEISLAHNQLDADSFSENFLLLDAHSIPVTLDLGHNHIVHLKENVFRPLLDKMVNIDLHGNAQFDCARNDWVKENPRYYLKVKGTKCW